MCQSPPLAMEIHVSVHKLHITIFVLLTFIMDSKIYSCSRSDVQRECCFVVFSITDLLPKIQPAGKPEKLLHFLVFVLNLVCQNNLVNSIFKKMLNPFKTCSASQISSCPPHFSTRWCPGL